MRAAVRRVMVGWSSFFFPSSFLFSSFLDTSICSRALDVRAQLPIFNAPPASDGQQICCRGGVVAFLALRCVLSWTRLPALWEKEKSKNRRHAESGVSLLRFSGSCVRRMEWRGRFGWQAGKNSHSYSPHTHPTSEVQWY